MHKNSANEPRSNTSGANIHEEAKKSPEKIVFTSRAARRFMEVRKNESQFLRLSVVGGGCHGYSYNFEFDTSIDKSEDLEFRASEDEITGETFPDIKLVVDTASLKILQGSVVDFVFKLGASKFLVKNPNIDTHCGCGSSFSIKK